MRMIDVLFYLGVILWGGGSVALMGIGIYWLYRIHKEERR